MVRHQCRFGALGLLIVIGAVGCGGDSPTESPSSPSAGSSLTTPPTSTGAAGTAGAGDSSTTGSATEAPGGEPAASADDATLFVEPVRSSGTGKRFSMRIPSSWSVASDSPRRWDVGPGGVARVEVISMENNLGVGLDEYLRFSIRTAPTTLPDFQLEDSGLVELENGDQGGRLIYTGTRDGVKTKVLTLIAAYGTTRVVTVNLVAPPERFDEIAPDVERYMRTVVALPVTPDGKPIDP